MDINEKIEKIQGKSDFVAFLDLLVSDFQSNNAEWENKSLDSYLEAISRWTEDMDGYYSNMKIPLPATIDWKVFARILIAAKFYE